MQTILCNRIEGLYVPVYHAYVNDDGYYITARPSDVGNITYQTTDEADTLICSLDYADGDDLPWGLINPLRSAGLVYTKGQGVDDDLEDTPDLDPSKLPELSETEVQELLSYLKSRGDIPQHVIDLLKEKIHSETVDSSSTIQQAVAGQFPTKDTHVKCIWQTDAHEEITQVEIQIKDDDITHTIECPDVTEWVISHPYDESWDGMAKAYETKPKIMRALGEVEDDLPFEINWQTVSSGGFIENGEFRV